LNRKHAPLVGLALLLASAGCTAILDLDRDFQESPSLAGGDSGGGGNDATTSPDVSTGQDGSGGADTAPPPDTDANAPDTGADAGRRRDAAADAKADTGIDAASGLACGAGLSCSGGTPICCYVSGGTSTCSAAACGAGLAIPCHVATDCAATGKLCCVEITGTTASNVSCQDVGSCTVSATQTMFCDPAGGAGVCPAGKTCQVTNLGNVPASYYSCQ
jgi:hypothetical protein